MSINFCNYDLLKIAQLHKPIRLLFVFVRCDIFHFTCNKWIPKFPHVVTSSVKSFLLGNKTLCSYKFLLVLKYSFLHHKARFYYSTINTFCIGIYHILSSCLFYSSVKYGFQINIQKREAEVSQIFAHMQILAHFEQLCANKHIFVKI